MLDIEIVYGLAQRQKLYSLKLEEGSSVHDALSKIDIQQDFPNVDLSTAVVGIFGKVVKRETVLRNHDRIEIYRPLIADPKEARRQRAEQAKEQK